MLVCISVCVLYIYIYVCVCVCVCVCVFEVLQPGIDTQGYTSILERTFGRILAIRELEVIS